MPVGELLSRMSSREIEEWKVFYTLEASDNAPSNQQSFDFG